MRSTSGGETSNEIHHMVHLSLKTSQQAVVLSEPPAVAGGQAPPSQRRETLIL